MGNQTFALVQPTRSVSTSQLASSISVSGRYHKEKRMEDDYVVQKDVLGAGYTGNVYKARGKHNGRMFAVKGFRLSGATPDKKAELKAEAEIFLQMDHPHIARLVAVYEFKKQLLLVMECMEGGELFERLVSQKRFSEATAAHSVWQMLLAVNYIHSHGVVHRDIKLENFLYETKEGDHLKLIDFGFSKIWSPNTKMRASCGTLAYVAPEVLSQNYTSKCDLWSLGVVTFILLLGHMPFDGSEEVQMKNIREGNYKKKPGSWNKLSHNARDFIEHLLVLDAAQRFSAEQALKHPFIADRDQSGRYHITPLARIGSNDFDQGSLNVDNETIDALCSFAQASKFRRACLSLMAWSLSVEERSMVRDAFIELDVERQGTIKLHQLKEVLQAKFDVEDENIKPLMESLGKANGEEIHYSEFLAAMVSTRIAMHEEHLVATFRRFDADNNGFITREDLKTVLGESFNQDDVNKMIQEVDPTNEGQISYLQFVEYLRSPDADPQHANAALKIIDNAPAASQELEGLGEVPVLRAHSNKHQPTGEAALQADQAAGQGQPPPTRGSQVCAIL